MTFDAVRKPLFALIGVTLLAAVLAQVLPEAHAATGVGLCFLGATYFLVWRHDTATIREFGLGLGGLFETEPLDPKKLASTATRALGWAFSLALIVLPGFAIGYRLWYQPRGPFEAAPWLELLEQVPGQLLGTAFPEEAFYRGYAQSALDRAWPPKRRYLGIALGPGVLLSSAVFAAGHFLTQPVPGRLAVFFPSLLFGALRARTGGIGASVVFHASCNLFVWYLGRSYGLFRA
ncbi:MAG TPA: MrtC family glutamic-type intramembrane protease [Polyangiaceae bacterium]|nr:MrtC family glutamic-type intramembrane protease [Polyangiaceae bacterium]